MTILRSLLLLPTILLLVDASHCAEAPPLEQTYRAHDSLSAASDPSTNAQQCLAGLCWQAGTFDVVCTTQEGTQYDQLVRFPTSRPSGDKVNDLVALEWYSASDEEGRVIDAPAVLVVHESGSAMIVGRLFALSLQSRGIHAFLIQLPYYGHRRTGAARPRIADFAATMCQGVADVRRARDAIAVLPHVDRRQVSVQGTSLGGFVATTAASLDGCFSNVFIMMAGGNLFDMINNGQKDAAKVRQLLVDAGYTDDELKKLLGQVEPLRLAHRLDPKTTWLYSAEQDEVVPIKNALALAEAARLDSEHHVKVIGTHYTAISHFPFILEHMVTQIHKSGQSPGDSR